MEFIWFLSLNLVFKIHPCCGVYTLLLFMIVCIPHYGYTIIDSILGHFGFCHFVII